MYQVIIIMVHIIIVHVCVITQDWRLPREVFTSCTRQIPKRTGSALCSPRLRTPSRLYRPLISPTLPGGLRDNHGGRGMRKREGGSSKDLRYVTTAILHNLRYFSLFYCLQITIYSHGVFNSKFTFAQTSALVRYICMKF